MSGSPGMISTTSLPLFGSPDIRIPHNLSDFFIQQEPATDFQNQHRQTHPLSLAYPTNDPSSPFSSALQFDSHSLSQTAEIRHHDTNTSTTLKSDAPFATTLSFVEQSDQYRSLPLLLTPQTDSGKSESTFDPGQLDIHGIDGGPATQSLISSPPFRSRDYWHRRTDQGRKNSQGQSESNSSVSSVHRSTSTAESSLSFSSFHLSDLSTSHVSPKSTPRSIPPTTLTSASSSNKELNPLISHQQHLSEAGPSLFPTFTPEEVLSEEPPPAKEPLEEPELPTTHQREPTPISVQSSNFVVPTDASSLGDPEKGNTDSSTHESTHVHHTQYSSRNLSHRNSLPFSQSPGLEGSGKLSQANRTDSQQSLHSLTHTPPQKSKYDRRHSLQTSLEDRWNHGHHILIDSEYKQGMEDIQPEHEDHHVSDRRDSFNTVVREKSFSPDAAPASYTPNHAKHRPLNLSLPVTQSEPFLSPKDPFLVAENIHSPFYQNPDSSYWEASRQYPTSERRLPTLQEESEMSDESKHQPNVLRMKRLSLRETETSHPARILKRASFQSPRSKSEMLSGISGYHPPSHITVTPVSPSSRPPIHQFSPQSAAGQNQWGQHPHSVLANISSSPHPSLPFSRSTGLLRHGQDSPVPRERSKPIIGSSKNWDHENQREFRQENEKPDGRRESAATIHGVFRPAHLLHLQSPTHSQLASPLSVSYSSPLFPHHDLYTTSPILSNHILSHTIEDSISDIADAEARQFEAEIDRFQNLTRDGRRVSEAQTAPFYPSSFFASASNSDWPDQFRSGGQSEMSELGAGPEEIYPESLDTRLDPSTTTKKRFSLQQLVPNQSMQSRFTLAPPRSSSMSTHQPLALNRTYPVQSEDSESRVYPSPIRSSIHQTSSTQSAASTWMSSQLSVSSLFTLPNQGVLSFSSSNLSQTPSSPPTFASSLSPSLIHSPGTPPLFNTSFSPQSTYPEPFFPSSPFLESSHSSARHDYLFDENLREMKQREEEERDETSETDALSLPSLSISSRAVTVESAPSPPIAPIVSTPMNKTSKKQAKDTITFNQNSYLPPTIHFLAGNEIKPPVLTLSTQIGGESHKSPTHSGQPFPDFVQNFPKHDIQVPKVTAEPTLTFPPTLRFTGMEGSGGKERGSGNIDRFQHTPTLQISPPHPTITIAKHNSFSYHPTITLPPTLPPSLPPSLPFVVHPPLSSSHSTTQSALHISQQRGTHEFTDPTPSLQHSLSFAVAIDTGLSRSTSASHSVYSSSLPSNAASSTDSSQPFFGQKPIFRANTSPHGEFLGGGENGMSYSGASQSSSTLQLQTGQRMEAYETRSSTRLDKTKQLKQTQSQNRFSYTPTSKAPQQTTERSGEERGKLMHGENMDGRRGERQMEGREERNTHSQKHSSTHFQSESSFLPESSFQQPHSAISSQEQSVQGSAASLSETKPLTRKEKRKERRRLHRIQQRALRRAQKHLNVEKGGDGEEEEGSGDDSENQSESSG
ncbi:hypothetical protein BLNAU_7724 [Blattamonas nauphoetae]|uniref:Uncharacterized protein n=1 Tax=Blattamonas nauphoetae TaxID=2049346 RepID=A0ABQ9Y0S5_9EUKA|nr:hypothetical protein BLNAU_7724 [Blattamonas nauphoetae]